MGTKINPGVYDCYRRAEDDEPLFTLLARDPLAPILVSLWAALREHGGDDKKKVSEARTCAVAMLKWRRDREDCERKGSEFEKEDQTHMSNTLTQIEDAV